MPELADPSSVADVSAPPTPPLPARRPELLLRPLGDRGQYVVKDPTTGEYFNLGEQEHFLLVGLDGRQTADALRAAFERQFGEPLGEEDLSGFVAMASAMGFLRPAADTTPVATAVATPAADSAPAAPAPPRPKPQQSLLFWRKSVFEPDRFFN